MQRDDILRKKLSDKSAINAATGCIKWRGLRNRDGYGRVCTNGTVYLAHRVAYAVFVKDPGDGVVCHTCDNPSCINPDHLFLGTQADNIRDCKIKGRISKVRARGERHGNSKFTDEEIRAIKIDMAAGLSKKQMMSKYPNLGRSTYEALQQDRWWKHISIESKS